MVKILKRTDSLPELNSVLCSSTIDVDCDRLPRSSPYVGTFHRGFRVSSDPTNFSDIRPERLKKNCPYVGTFHRGYSVSQVAPDSVTVDGASPKKKIDGSHLPKSPELCGLQAILPRQCGVRILGKLGEGSFGKVVLAVNRRNKACWTDPSFFRKLTGMPEEGDSVVLKCVRKDCCYGARGLQCVAREVELHSQCFHPNISRMYGYYENGQYVTMILEFIDGKELFEILRIRRQVAEDEACLISVQILRGVKYLHDRMIVHRDLTPHNIMVKESGHAFVIDLGLAFDINAGDANEVDIVGSPVGAVGSMGYMSPEAIRREKVTMAVDSWSIGVILYESVFGFPPFAAHEILSPSTVEFPDASWTPSSSDLQDLLGKMLTKSGAWRMTVTSALEHPLFSHGASVAADAVIPPPSSTTSVFAEPPPLWLGDTACSSWSSSSEFEPEIPTSASHAPSLSFPVTPQHQALASQQQLATRKQESVGVKSDKRDTLANDGQACGPEKGVEEVCAGSPPQGGRERDGGKKVGRRECVLQLDGEIRGDGGGGMAGLDGAEGNMVYVARIVKAGAL